MSAIRDYSKPIDKYASKRALSMERNFDTCVDKHHDYMYKRYGKHFRRTVQRSRRAEEAWAAFQKEWESWQGKELAPMLAPKYGTPLNMSQNQWEDGQRYKIARRCADRLNQITYARRRGHVVQTQYPKRVMNSAAKYIQARRLYRLHRASPPTRQQARNEVLAQIRSYKRRAGLYQAEQELREQNLAVGRLLRKGYKGMRKIFSNILPA